MLFRTYQDKQKTIWKFTLAHTQYFCDPSVLVRTRDDTVARVKINDKIIRITKILQGRMVNRFYRFIPVG